MLPIMTKKIEKKSPRSYQGQGLSALWLCFLMFVFGYLAASWFDVNQLVKWVGNRFAGHPAVEKVIAEKSETIKPVREQHPKLEFYTLLTTDAGLHNPSSEPTTIDVQYKPIQAKSNTKLAEPNAVGPMELALTAPVPASEPTTPTPAAKPNPSPFPPQGSTTTKPAAPSRPVLPKPLSDELKPAAAPVPVSATERSYGRYVIQVASFRSQTEARKLREKLLQRGYNVKIMSVMQQSTYWYRVMVGPFPSMGQAQQVQSALSYQEHVRGMIRKD